MVLLLVLLLLLLAVLVKKVESNVTAAFDETLRPWMNKRRAKSLAT